MNKIMKATEMARKAHEGQTRTNGDPYISHPLRVANTVQSLNSSPVVNPSEVSEAQSVLVCAALLHDVIEDTTVDRSIIAREFGEEVASLVEELTNKHPDKTPFEIRHAAMLQKAASMSEAAKKIKVADRYDNVKEMSDWQLWRQRRYAKASQELLAAMSPIPKEVEPMAQEILAICGEVLAGT